MEAVEPLVKADTLQQFDFSYIHTRTYQLV
jgi:hypothetical protein